MKSSHRSLATSTELDPKAAETKRSRLAAAGSLALRSKLPILSIAVMGITGLMLGGTANAAPPPTPIGLGAAANAAVEAGQSITNTNPSTITGTGDASVSPGSSATGFGNCPGADCVTYTTGTLHINDGVANAEVADAHTALVYTQGLGGQVIPDQLGGTTLSAGIYTLQAADIAMSTTLQLDAAFSANSVWIFNARQTITANPLSNVVFINRGAATDAQLACNVFWTTASSATLNGPQFVGTVMAQTAITVGAGVTVTGRLLSGTANATLNSDTIIQPQGCTTGAAGTGGVTGGTSGGGSVATGGGSGGGVAASFAGPATPVASLPKLTG